MGSLQGRVRGKEMIIMDSFELPVEGTETRVSAANEGYEYMVQYMTQAEQVQENFVGSCAQYLRIYYCSCTTCTRRGDKKTPLVGITHILVTVVGSLE